MDSANLILTEPVTAPAQLEHLAKSKLDGATDEKKKQIAKDFESVLLNKLFDHSENPKFVYEHRWHLGDLLMWDNRCTLHARRGFDPEESRIMRRLTVLGETPA